MTQILENSVEVLSESVEKIGSVLKDEYPLVSSRAWDLSCLNEFVNHLLPPRE